VLQVCGGGLDVLEVCGGGLDVLEVCGGGLDVLQVCEVRGVRRMSVAATRVAAAYASLAHCHHPFLIPTPVPSHRLHKAATPVSRIAQTRIRCSRLCEPQKQPVTIIGEIEQDGC
jgi:hypothetical protein